MLKKFLFAAVAALLLSSCHDNSDSIQEAVDENILGSWKLIEVDGKSALTDQVDVITFMNYNRATISNNYKVFSERKPHIYVKDGSEVLLMSTDETGLVDIKMLIKSIDEEEMIADVEKVFVDDNQKVVREKSEQKYSRMRVDYGDKIKALWQGVASENQTYGDDNHRWEYYSDGSYTYFTRDSVTGFWIPSVNAMNRYYVDGDLLACNWIDSIGGNEFHENWNTRIDNDRMVWNGEREDSLGGRFTSTFEMKKLAYPTEAQLGSALDGNTWKAVVQNGILTATDYRSVREYRDGKLIIKTPNAVPQYGGMGASSGLMTYDTLLYDVNDNVILETSELTGPMAINYETTVSELSDSSFSARVRPIFASSGIAGSSADLYETARYTSFVVFDLSESDFSKDISGLWEGVELTGEENPMLSPQHRFEFLNNGRYRFYSKNAQGEWTQDFESTYTVEGSLLGFEYPMLGRTVREWWDLDGIDSENMFWSAYRINTEFNLQTMRLEQTQKFSKFRLKKVTDQ
ncbi:MAG: hypothetical protein MJY65_02075 [Bacteroidaceae bacterium]|nr:hypothetical protein [Bacteroidaceae bacterium]